MKNIKSIHLVIIIILVAALIILSLLTLFLARDISNLKTQMESENSEHLKLISANEYNLEKLRSSEAQLKTQLDDARKEVTELNKTISELSEQYAAMESQYRISKISENDIVVDNIIINRYIPVEVIKLFETLLESISKEDETLFLSTVLNTVPMDIFPEMTADEYHDLMIRKFGSFTKADYTLKKITPCIDYGSQMLQMGYIYVYIADEDGHLSSLGFEIGIALNLQTGQWKIFDFH